MVVQCGVVWCGVVCGGVRCGVCTAAWYELSPLVEYLLSRGASPSLANKKLQQPLHWACMSGDMKSVIALMNAGADIYVKVLMLCYTMLCCAVLCHSATVLCYVLSCSYCNSYTIAQRVDRLH